MKIGIVGGAGYLGSALIPALLARDHDVTVFDTFWFGDHLSKRVNKRKVDARRLALEDIQGLDALIFLAGLSNDPLADFNPLLNFSLNAALPAYIADLAYRAGVKTFIHGGSCSVYGKTSTKVKETDPVLTYSPYGVSKLMGELACLQYQDKMRVVAFRMGTICGYSPRMRFDLVINAMVKDAVSKRWITVNDPQAVRPILDIHDAVFAYLLALTDEQISGTINIMTENVRILGLAAKIQAMVQYDRRTKVVIEERNKPDIRSYEVDNSKALGLGIAVRHTIDQTIENVLSYGDFDSCEDDRYYNIRAFQKLLAPEITDPQCLAA